MKLRTLPGLLLCVFLLACGTAPTATLTPSPTIPLPTVTLPPAGLEVTSVPDSTAAARAYLDAWTAEKYADMYALLTPISREAISAEKFEEFYRGVAAEAALKNWEYEILSALTNPRSAQVGYRVTLHSVLIGDIVRETQMNLSLEEGRWHVQWEEGLLLPELRGGNFLRMEYRTPSRANLYDRSGSALVAQSDAVAIGLDTGQVDPENQESLVNLLARLTGVRPDKLATDIDNYRSYSYYLPVGDISVEELAARQSSLAGYSGVILSPFRGRYYFGEGIAPHVVGYVSAIQQEQIEQFKRLGYNVYGDRVGQKGLEAWGEQYLAGKRGGVLYLVDGQGTIITRLAETNAEPAQAIYTTLDRDLQIGAQEAMSIYRGAVVVLERDTGRVLAMASSPGFNPNLFEPQNYNYSYLINDLFDPDRLPLLNRATQGQYPLGSVFKIITLSAALQSGLFTTESEYNCQYSFTELGGVTLYDWTYQHFQEDGKTQPSGQLTLPQGLMRSCNPWFWHIGYDFYSRGMLQQISNMARGFGLGSATGFELPEEKGAFPDPASPLDATNLAIGQGGMLVTPLQVASFVAAVGNGGTLYTPRVVERISPLDGAPTFVFTPTVRGTLPISPTVLTAVQQAMVSVIQDERGTANFVLGNFVRNHKIPLAGKTGTAETSTGQPHAWFAGYSYAEREDKPDIAIVVFAEYGGEGSEVAAPIFRRVMEIYFLGRPQTRYPWESGIGVVATETPEPSEAETTPEP